MPDLIVLHEHPEWQKPLFAALARRGVSFEPFDVTRAAFSNVEPLRAPIYFNQAPVFNVTPRDTVPVGENRDPAFAAQQERMRAQVILRFHEKADSLLVSGLLVAGDELAGKPAVVDAPVGSGHVVLFGIRPLWRWESQGSFALALNAIANWNHLNF